MIWVSALCDAHRQCAIQRCVCLRCFVAVRQKPALGQQHVPVAGCPCRKWLVSPLIPIAFAHVQKVAGRATAQCLKLWSDISTFFQELPVPHKITK